MTDCETYKNSNQPERLHLPVRKWSLQTFECLFGFHLARLMAVVHFFLKVLSNGKEKYRFPGCPKRLVHPTTQHECTILPHKMASAIIMKFFSDISYRI